MKKEFQRLVPVLLVVIGLSAAQIAAGAAANCPDPTVCNGGTGVTADQVQGEFHGLIAVAGQPEVLETAAHSGTTAGCGDCVWTLVMMCLANTPVDPHNQQPCTGAGRLLKCRPGQTAFRLYLSTKAATNRLVETICLGGSGDVIPIGDIAAADVARYLRDVRPPELSLRFQPPREAIAGLATYFMVRPPAELHPTSLTSATPDIVETITIAPLHYTWAWGDGTDSLATDDAGAPYPDGHVTHTYESGGRVTIGLTTQWGATYTITTAGQTFGPYDATGGVVPLTQTISLPIATAHSHLVSH